MPPAAAGSRCRTSCRGGRGISRGARWSRGVLRQFGEFRHGEKAKFAGGLAGIEQQADDSWARRAAPRRAPFPPRCRGSDSCGARRRIREK